MIDFLAIAAPAAYLFGGGQNQYFPRTAALCAAAIAALALCACAQPLQPQPATPSPAPLPPTDAPTHPTLAISAPAPPSQLIAAHPATSATPADAPVAQPTPVPTPTSLPPTPAPAPPSHPPAEVVFTQITAGKAHACALRENAAAICWGRHSDDGSIDVPAETAFSQISAGRNFTCGLRQDATIACWGRNTGGKATPPQGSFSEIAAGSGHACAVPISQGSPSELVCWGAPFPNGAESLPLDAPLSDIQSGDGFTCGLTPQADMVCLRMNRRLPEITPGPFTRLSAGVGHICALREDGGAFCQGDNAYFQATPPSTKFTHIAAGWQHTCGITQARAIECWGVGVRGAPNERFAAHDAPGERLAPPNGEFAAIAIGWRNSCALRPNGRAVCWGITRPLFVPQFANLPIGVSPAFGGAVFSAPVDIFPWQGGGFAIVDREGIITAHLDQPDAPPPRTILDLTDAVFCCSGESGMLSAALDPQFQDFPFLYIWYKTVADNALGKGAPVYVGRLARFRVNRDAAIKNSELPILEIPLPKAWHLGGDIRFGADGMLYLGIGDNETPADAQSLNNLRGKIIRIDVRGANAERPYRIPPDNPFVDNPDALPEIWAYGLRNPWRMAFDPKNPARLFVADVGHQTSEEVSIAVAAANLGWPLCEGDVCQEPIDAAVAAKLTPPAIAYPRGIGCAVIGGVTVPWLNHGFIFGDLCARRVWLLEPHSDPAGAHKWRMRLIANIESGAHSVLAFGAGHRGSVYILSYNRPILRIDPILADNLPAAE